MYFGSVRFFRHLIYMSIFTPILILTITVIVLLTKYHHLEDQIKKVEKQISELMVKLDEPQNIKDEESISNKTVEEQESNLLQSSNEIAVAGGQKKLFDTYPMLTAASISAIVNPDKTIYLTFDDGPSLITTKLLDTLKAQGVKATFFVIGNQIDKYPEVLKRIVDEGHAIGIHTDTHQYNQIYASLDALLYDYEQTIKKINLITNYPVTTYRLPGGSLNNYNKHISGEIIQELKNRGFSNFDWNISSGDANQKGLSSKEIITNVLSNVNDKNVGIVLMHDSDKKITTSEALNEIIVRLRDLGYSFGTLNNEIQTIQFYKDNEGVRK